MASIIKSKEYDVVVVGGGNAGLCAAISAAEGGGSVLLIEKAPQEERGGNTKYTVFLRFTHGGDKSVIHFQFKFSIKFFSHTQSGRLFRDYAGAVWSRTCSYEF